LRNTSVGLAGLALVALSVTGVSAFVRVSSTGQPEAYEASSATKDLVVLVHGLGRTPFSMMPLEWALEEEGYEVLNWGYSSTCCTVSSLAEQLGDDLRARTASGNRRVHFVGHSLGNIIVRSLISERPPFGLGRVVMLAPPNQGARAAGRYEPFVGWLLTPLEELSSQEPSAVIKLPLPPMVEVGVIAGQHDGKVTVDETHLAGERDHAVVPSAHTFIMTRVDVQRLVTSFLEFGTFAPRSPISPSSMTGSPTPG